MQAYLIPGHDHDSVLALPYWPRLVAWAVRPVRLNTPQGCLITAPGAPLSLLEYQDPVESAIDPGLRWLPPAPAQIEQWRADGSWRADLLRPAHQPCADLDLVNGLRVSLALGLIAPAAIAVAGGRSRAGRPACELGRLAWELWQHYGEQQEGADLQDPDTAQRIGWLIFLALQAIYAVSEDLFNALEMITTADLGPALTVIWGGDPKAYAAAAATSQPAPAALSTDHA